jgi:hypothetical protein
MFGWLSLLPSTAHFWHGDAVWQYVAFFDADFMRRVDQK